MNDLPAAWAHLAPYLFVVAAAVASVSTAAGWRRRGSVPEPVAAGARAAGPWTVSPPWEPALRYARSATVRVARDPLVGAAIALAAFGLAIGRQPLVAFLGLFMIPTAALAPGAFRGRGGLEPFIAGAASDLCLVLGLMHRHTATGVWSTPVPGRVGVGAVLVCLAAGLRLAWPGFIRPGSVRPGLVRPEAVRPWAGATPQPVLAAIGWFQGLFLAWWAGRPAAAGLALIALLLVLVGIAAARARRQEAGLLFAGALAALLAGLGAGAATVAVVGLAGTAFAMGERAVSLATLALSPLSAPAMAGVLPALRPWLPAALGIAVVAWAAALHSLLQPPPEAARWRGVPAFAAAAGTAAFLAWHGTEALMWAAYGLGGAGVLAALAVKPLPAPARTSPASSSDAAAPGIGSVREAGLAALGAGLLIVALLVLGGLTIAGLRTSFL